MDLKQIFGNINVGTSTTALNIVKYTIKFDGSKDGLSYSKTGAFVSFWGVIDRFELVVFYYTKLDLNHEASKPEIEIIKAKRDSLISKIKQTLVDNKPAIDEFEMEFKEAISIDVDTAFKNKIDANNLKNSLF